jgi:hypothetical protein
MVWDNAKQKFTVELTVNSPILNLLVSLNRIVVVQQSHIHVFSMGTFELATYRESGFNPGGLCALSPDPRSEYLVFPALKPGSIEMANLRDVSHLKSSAQSIILAHETEIVRLAIDNQATKIASGSKIGTIIRVFCTKTKAKLYELRRGSQPAELSW